MIDFSSNNNSCIGHFSESGKEQIKLFRIQYDVDTHWEYDIYSGRCNWNISYRHIKIINLLCHRGSPHVITMSSHHSDQERCDRVYCECQHSLARMSTRCSRSHQTGLLLQLALRSLSKLIQRSVKKKKKGEHKLLMQWPFPWL